MKMLLKSFGKYIHMVLDPLKLSLSGLQLGNVFHNDTSRSDFCNSRQLFCRVGWSRSRVRQNAGRESGRYVQAWWRVGAN